MQLLCDAIGDLRIALLKESIVLLNLQNLNAWAGAVWA